MTRVGIWALLAASLLGGAVVGGCGGSSSRHAPPVTQELVEISGHVEPHTPGSGMPEEVALAPDHPLLALLGPEPDLNKVSYLRTSRRLRSSRGAPDDRPRAIVILIPGFLAGGKTFDPLARRLVARSRGSTEVWAVERRPNQLEDRLGALHARAGADAPACRVSPPEPECAIFEGAQFYFADLDLAPAGNFPGPEDKDIDLDGVLDAQLPLVDAFGVSRTAITFDQDDLRGFLAHWGIDTYVRDLQILAERARAIVGPHGVVLMGGHSQGTDWATVFAAYDFDKDPNVVDAGHDYIDGLVLIEGSGIGPGSLTPLGLPGYELTVRGIAEFSVPAFVDDLSGIPLQSLGSSGEVAAIAGRFQPDEPALIQRTPTFGAGLVALLFAAPATNEAAAGFLLDDDFSPLASLRASLGFSDNGPNDFLVLPGLMPFYLAGPANDGGSLRRWIDFDRIDADCVDPAISPGCALVDNGPPSDPNDPLASPKTNGIEREVSSLGDLLRTQFGSANGFEWYAVDRRVRLDLSYGRDASALVAEYLARDGNEGPLVVTQNAAVDVPVLAIGGTNGLAPEPKSFDRYLASIATPPEDRTIVMLEGYAHLDPLIARSDDAMLAISDFIRGIRNQKHRRHHGQTP